MRREDAKICEEEHEKRKLRSEFENEETTKALIGTRPGAHGVGVGGSRVISTGTEDLDDVLGGGVPLNGVFGIFLDDLDDENRGGFGGGEAVANVFAKYVLPSRPNERCCRGLGLPVSPPLHLGVMGRRWIGAIDGREHCFMCATGA